MFEGRLTLSIAEAAKALGISVNHAYFLAKRGDIPTIWLGGRRMVNRDHLREHLANATFCCLKPPHKESK